MVLTVIGHVSRCQRVPNFGSIQSFHGTPALRVAGTVPGGAGLDLQTAGISIIQVDEPALRELLPLREQDRKAYLVWAVSSFRLATAGVADSTAVHTHLCYSEFGDVIGAIDDPDADMTSLEAARSHMEVLGDLNADGIPGASGPVSWDIHSPRVPSTVGITES